MTNPNKTQSRFMPLGPAGSDVVLAKSDPDETFRFWLEGEAHPRVMLDMQSSPARVLVGNGTAAPTPLQGGEPPPATLIVQRNEATIAATASTVDFSSEFALTESPANEANVAIGPTIARLADLAAAISAHEAAANVHAPAAITGLAAYVAAAVRAARTGVIEAWAGAALPSGALWCHGTILQRSAYAPLFGIIGTTYNTGGEAGTEFRVPDLRDRVPVGAGGGLGVTVGGRGGTATETLTTAQMPSHRHAIYDPGHHHGVRSVPGAYPNENPYGLGSLAVTDTFHYNTGWNTSNLGMYDEGGGLAHNNLPPYLGLNYIIWS